MKRIITALALFAASLGAFAQSCPNGLQYLQRNEVDNGAYLYYACPTLGTDSFIAYDQGTNKLYHLKLGSGLTRTGDVLSVATGVAPAWASITGKPTTRSGYGITDALGASDLAPYATSASVTSALAGYATSSDLTAGLAGKAATSHTHVAADISDSTATGRAILTASTAGSARSTLGVLSTSEVAAAYYPLTNPAGYLSSITNAQVTAALGLTPVSQAGARTAVSLTTTGSGAATYNNSTGVLNVPTPAAAAPFNFSQPTARTLAVSTSYQALDNTKAAIIVPSYSCQNATQVLVSSACTVQVRMGTGTLTCSTGTVYYTQSLAVNLGVLLTQTSINPVQISLPIGASFILCATAGTFTTTTVEQTAG